LEPTGVRRVATYKLEPKRRMKDKLIADIRKEILKEEEDIRSSYKGNELTVYINGLLEGLRIGQLIARQEIQSWRNRE